MEYMYYFLSLHHRVVLICECIFDILTAYAYLCNGSALIFLFTTAFVSLVWARDGIIVQIY